MEYKSLMLFNAFVSLGPDLQPFHQIQLEIQDQHSERRDFVYQFSCRSPGPCALCSRPGSLPFRGNIQLNSLEWGIVKGFILLHWNRFQPDKSSITVLPMVSDDDRPTSFHQGVTIWPKQEVALDTWNGEPFSLPVKYTRLAGVDGPLGDLWITHVQLVYGDRPVEKQGPSPGTLELVDALAKKYTGSDHQNCRHWIAKYRSSTERGAQRPKCPTEEVVAAGRYVREHFFRYLEEAFVVHGGREQHITIAAIAAYFGRDPAWISQLKTMSKKVELIDREHERNGTDEFIRGLIEKKRLSPHAGVDAIDKALGELLN